MDINLLPSEYRSRMNKIFILLILSILCISTLFIAYYLHRSALTTELEELSQSLAEVIDTQDASNEIIGYKDPSSLRKVLSDITIATDLEVEIISIIKNGDKIIVKAQAITLEAAGEFANKINTNKLFDNIFIEYAESIPIFGRSFENSEMIFDYLHNINAGPSFEKKVDFQVSFLLNQDLSKGGNSNE